MGLAFSPLALFITLAFGFSWLLAATCSLVAFGMLIGNGVAFERAAWACATVASVIMISWGIAIALSPASFAVRLPFVAVTLAPLIVSGIVMICLVMRLVGRRAS